MTETARAETEGPSVRTACTRCGCPDAACREQQAVTRKVCCRSCALFDTHPEIVRTDR